MPIYIYAKNGKDLADIFESGNSGITTGYKTANGQDIGQMFAAGNSGISTGLIASNGKDLGNIFAKPMPMFLLTVINDGPDILYVKSSTQDRSIGRYSRTIFSQEAGQTVNVSGYTVTSKYSTAVNSNPPQGSMSSNHTFVMPESGLTATFTDGSL